MCFSNLGDLCLEYCSVLGGISGNSLPYVLIFLPLSYTHTQTHTFKYIPICTQTVSHSWTQTRTYTHTDTIFSLKGKGKRRVCAGLGVWSRGDKGYKADSPNFLLQLEGNSQLLLWESMDKWDERTKGDNMDAGIMVVNWCNWLIMPQWFVLWKLHWQCSTLTTASPPVKAIWLTNVLYLENLWASEHTTTQLKQFL